MAAVFGAFAGSAGRTAAFDTLGAGRSTADMTAGCTASVFTGSSVGRGRSGCACFLGLVVPAASDPFLGAGDFVSAFAASEPFGRIAAILLFSTRMYPKSVLTLNMLL